MSVVVETEQRTMCHTTTPILYHWGSVEGKNSQPDLSAAAIVSFPAKTEAT
jgi:hypothetical protein